MDELINEIKNLKLQLNILSDKLDKLSKNNLSNKNKKWSFKEEELLIDELKNSLNIVKKGGSIYGDDYGVKPGTTKAVDEFIAETGYTLDNFYKDQFEIKI